MRITTPPTAQAMALAGYQDAAFLFGDSITQACTAGSLYQRTAEFYLRRLDVINRGFGGYNTEWGVPVFETVFPKKAKIDSGCAQAVPLLTIWFGANDSVLAGKAQHVPLDRYKSNLTKLIHFVNDPKSTWYSPSTRIVLITAPPIIPQEWLKHSENMWRQNGSKGPKPTEIDREPSNTKRYVEACLEVGKEQGIEVVNAWSAIVDQAGGSDAESLAPYFYDGLHLTAEGYEPVFNALTKQVLDKWPEMNPETMDMPTPHWATVDPQNPRGVLGPRPNKDEL